MIITCPACGKKNEGVDECTRCGCELAILEAIAAAASRTLAAGRESLESGSPEEALRLAAHSWYLKKSIAGARLAFLAALGAGDFDEASLWYRRAAGGAPAGSGETAGP